MLTNMFYTVLGSFFIVSGLLITGIKFLVASSGGSGRPPSLDGYIFAPIVLTVGIAILEHEKHYSAMQLLGVFVVALILVTIVLKLGAKLAK